jgi:hypothetical protein
MESGWGNANVDPFGNKGTLIKFQRWHLSSWNMIRRLN